MLIRRSGNRYTTSIWTGFVDVMTALLLVLIFLITIFLLFQFVLTSNATLLEAEIETLDDQISDSEHALMGLRKELTDRSRRIVLLESRIANQETALANLQATTIAQTQSLAERDAHLQRAVAQAADLQASLDARTTRIAVLEENLDSSRQQSSDLETRLAGLISERNAMAGETDRLARMLAEARDEQIWLAEQLAAARAEEETRRTAVAVLQRASDAAREELDATAGALTRSTDALERSRDRVARLEVRITELENSIVAGSVEFDALESRLQSTLTELERIGARYEQSQLAFQEREATIGSLETRVADLQARLQERARQVAAQDALLGEQETALLASTQGIEQLQSDLASRDTTIAGLESEVVQMESERLQSAALASRRATELAATIGSLETRVADLQARLQERARQVAAQDALLGEQETALLASTQGIEQLQSDLASRDTTIAGLESEVVQMESERLQSAALASRRATELAELAARFDDSETALALERQLSREQARALADLEARLLSLGDQLQISEAERAALLSSGDGALATIEALQAQVNVLQRDIALLTASLLESEDREAERAIQVSNLGARLNAALAEAAATRQQLLASETREKELLASEAAELRRYRSRFLAELRDLVERRADMQIVGDRFVFSSEVLFRQGSFILTERGREEIRDVASVILDLSEEIPPTVDWVLRVDGHTDNLPVRSGQAYRDNWELSQARALSVVRYLIDELGFPPGRLAATAFSEYRPVSPDSSRAQNRRIEFKLTEP